MFDYVVVISHAIAIFSALSCIFLHQEQWLVLKIYICTIFNAQ